MMGKYVFKRVVSEVERQVRGILTFPNRMIATVRTQTVTMNRK